MSNQAKKSTLYCPECWHESPLDGDWHLSEDGATVTYECPNCGTVITTRNSRRQTPLCC